MKKHLLILFLAVALSAGAQSRGVKIGYIDVEYILQNVPDYTEAKNQLEQKAQKWKQEIETKKNEIARLRDALNTEKVLLTKELIEEREEEIRFQEAELSDFQQKRFGPNGDLVIQKAVLIKPIQDQVFTAVQDISEAKKYDFIFDKSSDLTMLFAAKRHDISDQVVRALSRASRRDQLTKKQLKEEEAREAKEDMIDENPELAEREKALEDRRAAREKLIADRKAAAAEKKRLAEEKRQQAKVEKEARKNGTTPAGTTGGETPEGETTTETTNDNKAADTEATSDDPKKNSEEERTRKLEERKKAAEERRLKAAEAREAAKKAREEKQKENKEE